MATGRKYIRFGLEEPRLFSVAFVNCSGLPTRPDDPSARTILHDAILDLCNEGLVAREEVESVAHFAWSLVHGFTMLAGGADPYGADANATAIEEILERAWLGVTPCAAK